MTTHRFTYRPGIAAGPNAEALSLTNIRPVTPPAGPVLAFLESLNDWESDYTTVEMFQIAQTYLDLLDAGIIGPNGTSDRFWLPLPGNGGLDSLVDWCGNGALSNNGGTVNANGTISLDGTNDYLGSGITPSAGGLNYSLNSASMFCNIVDTTGLVTNDYVIGHLASGVDADTTLAPLTGSGTTATTRMNCTTSSVAVAYAGARTGTWIANRVDASITRLLRNDVLLGRDETDVADTLPASELCFGRHSTNYSQFVWGGGGFGSLLSEVKEAALSRIVAAHNAMFVG